MLPERVGVQAARVTVVLFLLNGLFWAIIAGVTVIGTATSGDGVDLIWLIVAVLMLGNVIALFLSSWLVHQRRRRAYAIPVAVVLANTLLTITDQVGPVDLLTLLINLVLLATLFAHIMARRKPTTAS